MNCHHCDAVLQEDEYYNAEGEVICEDCDQNEWN